jgi:electron transfer flavoprotein alpha subunit
MSNILVWVEQHDGQVSSSALGVACKAVELARELGGEAVALVAGNNADAVASNLGQYGLSKVLVASGDRFAQPIAEPYVDALDAAIGSVDPVVVLAGASVLAAEVAGGLAARRGVGINTDAVAAKVADGTVVVQRPALDDSVYVECGWSGASGTLNGIVLFRAGAFAPQGANGNSASIEQLDVSASSRPASNHLGHQDVETGGVDITQADVLVGAGRGLGSPDNFGLVESLAKSMGGEVATTRAVVDAGWYDYSTQVGQTGKTVTPKLYVAVGISGAIQHKVGMQNSGTVVAINKDPNAPIFEFADFGVVGDLFQIVPKLEAAVKEKKGQ